MAIEKLTMSAIRAARPIVTKKGKVRPRKLNDGGNLYAQIAPTKDGTVDLLKRIYLGSTAISWLFIYELEGARHSLGLGSLDSRTLKEARAEAYRCRQLLLAGKDPKTEKQNIRQARLRSKANGTKKRRTFDQVTHEYISAKQAGWGDEHARQWRQSMATYASPVLGKLFVDAIDVPLIEKVLKPIWETKTPTAQRVRGRIQEVLAFGAAKDYRPKGFNPASWEGNLAALLAKPAKIGKVVPLKALPHKAMPAYMAALRARKPGPHTGLGALALELTILLAGRVDELLSAKWGAVDFKDKSIAFPSEDMKGGLKHEVPLPKPAVELLLRVPRGKAEDLIFPGRNGGKLDPKTILLIARSILPDHADITVHGFRSTFSDWRGEETEFPEELVSFALAHKVQGVEGHYRRATAFERRRVLMAAWAQWCTDGTVPAEHARKRENAA